MSVNEDWRNAHAAMQEGNYFSTHTTVIIASYPQRANWERSIQTFCFNYFSRSALVGLDAKPAVAFVIIGIIYGERESDVFDETKSEQHVGRSVIPSPLSLLALSPVALQLRVCVLLTSVQSLFTFRRLCTLEMRNECNKINTADCKMSGTCYSKLPVRTSSC
jgi:hypothetical protein